MKPAKYPLGFRTKRDFIAAIKTAAANEMFFSRDTMRFFGRQKFDVIVWDDGAVTFHIEFIEKHPRFTNYDIDLLTLKLTPMRREANS